MGDPPLPDAADPVDTAVMEPTVQRVPVRNGELVVTRRGEGPPLVMLPSLGRGAADFDELASAVAANGWEAVGVDPRGVGDSTEPIEGATLHDLADDVAVVIDHVGGPAVVVGHAFGNRLARCVAADHPERVRGVVVLASGGLVPPADGVFDAITRCFDTTRSDEARLADVDMAFFAPGGDARPFLDGWFASAARAQAAANRSTPITEWWTAGDQVPVLIVQGLQDVVAVPANGRDLAEKVGGRATLVEIDGAGHALLPEQPGQVAAAVVAFLRALQPASAATRP